MPDKPPLRIAILGAGPIGLEATLSAISSVQKKIVEQFVAMLKASGYTQFLWEGKRNTLFAQ
jgi:NADPH-dependent 2,4-dienoyl-CoA reductase/sulfur reductase-like enzyme